jgi:hypothetical protein
MTRPIHLARAPPDSVTATHTQPPNFKPQTEEQIMYTNFMKHSFKHYFAPDGSGGYKDVSRSECFAYDKQSFVGKYPQQWYWDAENDFAIRLERNAVGKKIYNEARAERRRAVKTYLEQFGCVHNECLDCKGWDEMGGNECKCDTCIKHITFIPLDEEHEGGNGEKAVQFDSDSGVDVEQQIETNELLETLHATLRTLDNDDRKLWRFCVDNTRKRVIANYFGWTLDQLSYRQLKLYAKLRSNSALRKFFEKG